VSGAGAAGARVRAAGAALAMVLASATALADEPAPPPNARAERTAAGWAKLGARALPAALRAYCGQDLPLQQVAARELRRQGLPAVEALLRPTGESCDGSRLAGEVLCQVSPLDDAALRATLARLAPLVTAPYKRGRTPAPLWWMLTSMFPTVGSPYPPGPCANREQIARASVDVLLTPDVVARVAPENRQSFVWIYPALMSSRPAQRGAFVPILARWLGERERERESHVVVQALAAAGADAAPAVPALRAYLVRELDRARGGRDDLAASLGNVAKTAAAIGPAARPILGELRDALAVAAGKMCDLNRADDAGVILEAMAKLDASAWGSVRATVETAWRRAGNCGEPSSLSLVGDRGEWGSVRLMDGVGAFGPAAASFQTVLRPVLVSARASYETRGRAARALRRIGARLDAREAALAGVLEARLARREAVDWQARSKRPPETAGALMALDAITGCMADANILAQKPPTPADMAAFSYDENHAFASCVYGRVCGPGPEVLDDTLAVCCGFAYQGGGSPVFCAARPR
jgi:hypothetical protein